MSSACGKVCFIGITMVFGLVGFCVTVVGVVKLVEAQARDVNKDFELLSVTDGIDSRCVIDSWQSSREDSCDSEGHCSCDDKYRFEFCLYGDRYSNGVCATTYESKQASQNVCSNRCGSCSHINTQPHYAAGEFVTCWQPQPGYDPGSPYSCGNDECYKIFDPADEISDATTAGATMIPFGLIFMCVPLCMIFAMMKQQRMQRMRQNGATFGVPQQTTTPTIAMQPMGFGAQPVGTQAVQIATPPAPQMQVMQVQVPAGVQPGGTFMIQTPDGRQMQVQAQGGEGQMMQVQVPAAAPALPVVTAMAVAVPSISDAVAVAVSVPVKQ